MFQPTVLPRLADFHIIDYEPETEAITLPAIGDDLQPALETIQALEAPLVDEFLTHTRRQHA